MRWLFVSQGRIVVVIQSSDSDESDADQPSVKKLKSDLTDAANKKKNAEFLQCAAEGQQKEAERRHKEAERRQKEAERQQLALQIRFDKLVDLQPVECGMMCGHLMRHDDVNILSCDCKICPICVTSGVRSSLGGGSTPLCKALKHARVCNAPIQVGKEP